MSAWQNPNGMPRPVPPRMSVRCVTKIYPRGKESFRAVAGVDLDVAVGAFVAVMGQSGSGKTTLLNLLAGIDRPSLARSGWMASG